MSSVKVRSGEDKVALVYTERGGCVELQLHAAVTSRLGGGAWAASEPCRFSVSTHGLGG